ncbi:MAG: hypothetical protein SGPRY_006735, partial [Prymnesium sp.]
TLLQHGLSANQIVSLVREYTPELISCARREVSETLPEQLDEPKEKGHSAAVKRWEQKNPERVRQVKRDAMLRKAECSLRSSSSSSFMGSRRMGNFRGHGSNGSFREPTLCVHLTCGSSTR